MPKLPPLNSLRAFEAAYRHASFSKAGDELCVTHSAVSHQIKQLETWFGFELFTRTAHGVAPTVVGTELGLLVGDCFGRIGEAAERLRRTVGSPTVNVATIPSFATRWVIPRLPEFKQLHPEIDLLVSYAPPQFDGDLSKFDVLITYYDGIYAGDLLVNYLFSGSLKPVCSPVYLNAFGPISRLEDLAGATFLHDERRSTWLDWLASRSIEAPNARSGTVFADFNLLSTAAIAGHGVALCPIDLIRDDLAAGHLVQLFDEAILIDRNYVLFNRPSCAPAVSRFCEWLVAETRA